MSRDRLAVLRVRDFRLLFAAQAISMLGDRMVPIALAFAVIEQGGSPSEVGGVVADRVSRRAVMVASDLVRLASQAALAALLIAGAPSLAEIALLSGVAGLATGFFNPAATGLLPLVVRADQLQ